MMSNDLVRHVNVSVYQDELEILRKKAKNCGLPLSRYLVLKALNKLARE